MPAELQSHEDTLRNQYDTDANLRVRQSIYEHYQFPKVDFPLWVLARHIWRGDERVLDIGSGTGSYYDRVRDHLPVAHYFGLDRYAGLLSASAAPRRVQADAGQLPFGDDAFDVVMANHMLYHVADLDATLREIARVIQPGGILIAATNSLYNMPQIFSLVRQAIGTLMPEHSGSLLFNPPHIDFGLENGTRLLARIFYGVVRYELPTVLIFDSADPVIDYVVSWRSLFESQFPDGVGWDAAVEYMRGLVATKIRQRGEYAVELLSGALVATQDGGFLREYATRK